MGACRMRQNFSKPFKGSSITQDLSIVFSQHSKLIKRHTGILLIGIFCSPKNLEGTDYYCPTCKAKFDFELSDPEKSQPKVK